METMFIDQVKKHASSFLQERYRTARLVFTDVTQAELLTEEATNGDPWGPDAKTMTRIAEASYYVDDYWRIVDIIHRRLSNTDWKKWRETYKAFVLLEFLLTHGPIEFAEVFQYDISLIEELGAFKHIDKKGFNWGENMHKKSVQILKLLRDEESLKEARLRALKVTREIQGFGSGPTSPSESSSSSSSSPKSYCDTLRMTSLMFESALSCNNSPRKPDHRGERTKDGDGKNDDIRSHTWNEKPVKEKGSLLDWERAESEQNSKDGSSLFSVVCSKLAQLSPTKGSNSNKNNNSQGYYEEVSPRRGDAGKVMKKNA